MRRLTLLLGLMFLHAQGLAASSHDIMAAKYLRYLFCMDRALGQNWHQDYKIDLVINQWGIGEPTARSMASKPRNIQIQDGKCRKENKLENEPKP